MTNEQVKQTNEYQKKLALLEQERDFLKNDLHRSKENTLKNELEHRDTTKELRDVLEKAKNEKSKRKQVEKELVEMRSNY